MQASHEENASIVHVLLAGEEPSFFRSFTCIQVLADLHGISGCYCHEVLKHNYLLSV